MPDLDLHYESATQLLDIAIGNNGDLVSDEGLRSAVLLSLFTNRLAEPSDILPDERANRQGWWADVLVSDDLFGSRLWLLQRSNLTSETLRLAERYAQQSLQWMIDDAIARDIKIVAATTHLNTLCLIIEIYRQQKAPLRFRFEKFWSQQ